VKNNTLVTSKEKVALHAVVIVTVQEARNLDIRKIIDSFPSSCAEQSIEVS